METSNEHFHAQDIDTEIEQALTQAQANEPNAKLVADLQQFYQADAQADKQSLNDAWQHIHMRRRSPRSQHTEGKIIPMHIPSSSIVDKTQGRPRQRRLTSVQRTFALIAAFLVAALLAGNLVVVLSRAHIAQSGNTNITQPHPGNVVYSYKVSNTGTAGLQWSPDGKRIVLAGGDNPPSLTNPGSSSQNWSISNYADTRSGDLGCDDREDPFYLSGRAGC